jgi:L-alanine-DL-glutamate epimerase-like enolase superfamily enzyme
MTNAAGRRVVRIEAWDCAVPMCQPVRLGAIVYDARGYVVLRVTCDDGLCGHAIGYSRGTPLLEAVSRLGPFVGPLDVAEPAVVQATLSRMLLPGWAQMVRAVSLLDIALWDIRAQAERLPLHRLLGAERDDAALMAVAGYYPDVRSDDELIDEAVGFDAEGMGIKLILGGHDYVRDERVARRMREALPGGAQVGVDFHAPWRDVAEAARYCEPMAELDLRFIEDPFPGYEWRAMRDLAARLPTPIAGGEDVIGLSALLDLLEGVRFLRLDATASGGITTALDAIAAAEERGAAVVPHVFPYVHAVLCAARPAVANAEVIPASVGADPIDQLMTEPDPILGGRWILDEKPGLTLPLDWAAVERLAVASFVWNAPEES